MTPSRRARLCTALLTAVLALAACDNTVDPVVEDPPFFYAIYGYLDGTADTQFVRVTPLRSLPSAPAGPLGAAVSTVADGAEDRLRWRDSLVVLDDGSVGHLFFAPFRPDPGRAYRLEVRRGGALVTQAETTVPRAGPAEVLPPGPDFTQDLTQVVVFPELPYRAQDADVAYRVRPPTAETDTTIVFSYASRPGLRTPAGWSVTVRLSQDRRAILRQLGRAPDDSSVVLVDVRLSLDLLSPEWARPDAPTNIDNGVGFFGALGRDHATWRLDSAAVARLGFAVPARSRGASGVGVDLPGARLSSHGRLP